MQTRKLGDSDLQITVIGLGAWAMGGGDWSFGWGPQEDRDSIAAIHRALDQGINWIDTAAVYGFGRAEEVVAKALRGRQTKPYIFTKCGLVKDEAGNPKRVLKADSIRREVEESLRRLEVDCIDLYQIHWPNEDYEEAWAALADLKRQGKVRFIGVSNFDVEQMKAIQRIAPITSLQPPYSLVNYAIEAGILPFCQEHGIGVIVYSPMASGLLSGTMTMDRVKNLPPNDWRTRHGEFQGDRLKRNLALVELLRTLGDARGNSPGEIAIAWTLRLPAVTGAIVGARNSSQVDGFINTAKIQLTAEELGKIDAFLRAHP